MEPIVRVSISNDCEWETQFIPWLEEKEKNNVGVEDGVFVVCFLTYARRVALHIYH